MGLRFFGNQFEQILTPYRRHYYDSDKVLAKARLLLIDSCLPKCRFPPNASPIIGDLMRFPRPNNCYALTVNGRDHRSIVRHHY